MIFKPHELEYLNDADIGTIDIYGYRMSESQKYRNVAANPKVAFAVDTAIIRISPTRIISFGIDDTDTEPHQLEADIRDV